MRKTRVGSKADGFEIAELEENGIEAQVRPACNRLLQDNRRLRVCYDISSMSRHRIALIVDTLRSLVLM